ncbi:conserved hypothetical protein [Vibrio chagasii]|uniref:hypothetical protein n=1 Tax=Vibrio chagasii TaxID=170679 RepID=UPI001EFC4AF8|nr:hypothetical protein [Vibrio chagasii]MCG9674489.1 hypothetical protein [Vibrio chagasii]CAH7383196.1 conserved hypothetical protein [Vibrio chagasii]CAH7408216.1 conserved hypothetical protein [Vibrio chagasii]CAH7416245.1 conserved hypothetical protein [Vibrio chagasii]CAH7428163.1 conserved hypothetical protein [Vibrio chagasii]
MSKIYIFSDVSYVGYKHINHFLADSFAKSGSDVVFIDRVVLNWPTMKRLTSAVVQKFNKKKFKKALKDNGENYSKVGKPTIKKAFNLPPGNRCVNFLTRFLLRNIMKDICPEDKVIIFAPHPFLKELFYSNDVIYYCVHDSSKQKYSESVRFLEKELLKISKLNFFDNNDVASRLVGLDTENYPATLSGSKNIVIPSPVPSEFFENYNSKIKYDYVYFGSIHENIDIDVIKKLVDEGNRILIISSDFLDMKSNNITIIPAIYDIELLARTISESEIILFPYKNSTFMDTVTPAKLFQSLATGKKIVCSNTNLCQRYDFLIPFESRFNQSDLLMAHDYIDKISCLNTNNVCDFVLSKLYE